jgi:hypothetical protein
MLEEQGVVELCIYVYHTVSWLGRHLGKISWINRGCVIQIPGTARWMAMVFLHGPAECLTAQSKVKDKPFLPCDSCCCCSLRPKSACSLRPGC